MTSQTKFTPGPWAVVTNHPTNAVVRINAKCEDWHSDELAALYGPQEGEKDENEVWPLGETRMANAHLIAAAPDLYAALEGLAIAYKALSEMTGHTFHQDDCSRYQIAIAALAKARGETK